MVLRRNNSQKAGCMRRSPASHCCQVRQVVCTVAPAAVCDRPAASRAARISSGVGLRAAEAARERFGWLPMSDEVFKTGSLGHAASRFRECDEDISGLPFNAQPSRFGAGLLGGDAKPVICFHGCFDGDFDLGHDVSPVAPAPEARRIRRIHELNCTRNARTVNRFLQINFEGGSKPSNAEFSGAPAALSPEAPLERRVGRQNITKE